LSLLASELDSHSQLEISEFFLRTTNFVQIPSYLEVVVDDKEVNFEALDKYLPDR
jgi:hypothetical protein